MNPHVRVLVFCCALLLAPAVYALGDRFAGSPGAITGAGGVVLLSFAWVHLAPRRPESRRDEPSQTQPETTSTPPADEPRRR